MYVYMICKNAIIPLKADITTKSFGTNTALQCQPWVLTCYSFLRNYNIARLYGMLFILYLQYYTSCRETIWERVHLSYTFCVYNELGFFCVVAWYGIALSRVHIEYMEKRRTIRRGIVSWDTFQDRQDSARCPFRTFHNGAWVVHPSPISIKLPDRTASSEL